MNELRKPNRIKTITVGDKEKRIMRVKLREEARIHTRKRKLRYDSQWDVK